MTLEPNPSFPIPPKLGVMEAPVWTGVAKKMGAPLLPVPSQDCGISPGKAGHWYFSSSSPPCCRG